jgi:hypothetical protein
MEENMSRKTQNDVRELLFKTFGRDIEICDARHDKVVPILPEDIKDAQPLNPAECAFARACRRVTGFPAVFWKTVAYICEVDPTGRKRCYRYRLRKNVVDMIMKFDRGEVTFPIGAGILFSAPARKDRLPHLRKRSKEYRQSPIGLARDREGKARRQFRKAEEQLRAAEEQYQKAALTERPRSPKLIMVNKQKVAAKEAVNQAKERLARAEQTVKQAREHKPRAPMVFDLTTRNGMIGHYHMK